MQELFTVSYLARTTGKTKRAICMNLPVHEVLDGRSRFLAALAGRAYQEGRISAFRELSGMMDLSPEAREVALRLLALSQRSA